MRSFTSSERVARAGICPATSRSKSITWRYFDEWWYNGTLEVIHDALREKVRKAEGREPTPSAGSIDTQSVPAIEGG